LDSVFQNTYFKVYVPRYIFRILNSTLWDMVLMNFNIYFNFLYLIEMWCDIFSGDWWGISNKVIENIHHYQNIIF